MSVSDTIVQGMSSVNIFVSLLMILVYNFFRFGPESHDALEEGSWRLGISEGYK